MSDYPKELRYTKEHEWARIDGNVAQIGITAFAVEKLGDVTMVELPQEGEAVAKDDVFGTVESVKAVSDLYAPLTGKVIKVNSPLDDTPETVNDDPYGEGWLVEIELSNPAEAEELFDQAQYTEYLKELD